MLVDTSAWYANYVAADPYHPLVSPLIDGATTRLVTSDFIVAESLNLLRARNEFERAVRLGRDLLSGAIAELVEVTRADLERAFVIFSTYRDKAWSFTDCTSLVVMQRLSIHAAISLDQHFTQMPGIAVYPAR